MIKNFNFAPELLPVLKNPTEVQELRKINRADKQDIQDWIETAFEVLPAIAANQMTKIDKPSVFKKERLNNSFT